MNLLAGLRILKTIPKNSIYVCIERTTLVLLPEVARTQIGVQLTVHYHSHGEIK